MTHGKARGSDSTYWNGTAANMYGVGYRHAAINTSL